MTQAINGDKGWKIQRGKLQDLAPREIAQQKEELYGNWIATILPLKDPAFKLSPIAESKVDDKPAVGVRVSHKGYNDVDLYFDDKSGLLVKTLHRTTRPDGKEVLSEFCYSDYKDFDGVKVATKFVRKIDGKAMADVQVTEVKLLDKIDDKEFEKPTE